MSPKLPKKLKKDAIIEAICEIRFDTNNHSDLVPGLLGNMDLLKDFEPNSSPSADIPKSIRDTDSQLKYQPIVEFRNHKTFEQVKIGGNVISYHVVGEDKYKGGVNFINFITTIVNELFNKLTKIKVSRIGFRYINTLNSEYHNVNSLSDLDIDIKAGSKRRENNLNLNYFVKKSDIHHATVRIATQPFTNIKTENTVAIVDIDVYTPNDFNESDSDKTVNWIKTAHQYEKEEFFSLFPQNILEQLVDNE